MRRVAATAVTSGFYMFVGACTPSLTAGDSRTDESAQCRIHDVTRTKIALPDGRELFVEPVVVESLPPGNILLLGRISMMFERDSQETWQIVERDRLFGVVISTGDFVQVIPWPRSEPVGAIRAAPRDDDSWDVVFAEVVAHGDDPLPPTYSRLWYGMIEGSEWKYVQEVHAPPGVALSSTAEPSRLIRYGDTLAWALPIDTEPGRSDWAIFERRAGEWTSQIIPTLISGNADLGHSPSSGLLFAVVQPDTSILGGDGNSLFLWARQPAWTPIRKLVASSQEEVHTPRFTPSPEGLVLGWQGIVKEGGSTIGRVRVIPDVAQSGLTPVLTVAENVANRSLVEPFPLRGVGRVWVLERPGAPGRPSTIHLVADRNGTREVIGEVESPFLTRFRAASVGTTSLALVGGVYDQFQNSIAATIMRIQIHCD